MNLLQLEDGPVEIIKEISESFLKSLTKEDADLFILRYKIMGANLVLWNDNMPDKFLLCKRPIDVEFIELTEGERQCQTLEKDQKKTSQQQTKDSKQFTMMLLSDLTIQLPKAIEAKKPKTKRIKKVNQK